MFSWAIQIFKSGTSFVTKKIQQIVDLNNLKPKLTLLNSVYYKLYVVSVLFLKFILLKYSWFAMCWFCCAEKWIVYTHMHFFSYSFPFALSQDVDYTLCYTVGTCGLSTQYVIDCICSSQTFTASLPHPLSLGNYMSVHLFLFLR